MPFYEDSDIRSIYAKHKARAHGWPEVIEFPVNADGRYDDDDLETAYLRFRAGFRAAYDATLLSNEELNWTLLEAATGLAANGASAFMMGLANTDMKLAIAKPATMIQLATRDRIVLHKAEQVEAIANGSLEVDRDTINEMLTAYAQLLKAK